MNSFEVIIMQKLPINSAIVAQFIWIRA